MKRLMIVSIFLAGPVALGNPTSAEKKAAANGNSKLSTDIRFDGSTVGGKLQNPLEALSVVENEKSIDDLIGVRKDFRDRSQKAKGLR